METIEEVQERRKGERRVAEPCIHERDWIRLDQVVERHDRELKALSTDGAETKVYMKQVLESQKEIKESIREIQDELKSRPAQAAAPVPVELVQSPQQAAQKQTGDWGETMRKAFPDIIRFGLILVIIIAVLVGADNIVTKAVGVP